MMRACRCTSSRAIAPRRKHRSLDPHHPTRYLLVIVGMRGLCIPHQVRKSSTEISALTPRRSEQITAYPLSFFEICRTCISPSDSAMGMRLFELYFRSRHCNGECHSPTRK